MINDSQPSGLDVSSYTIEEIDSITSEYTLKNTVRFTLTDLTYGSTVINYALKYYNNIKHVNPTSFNPYQGFIFKIFFYIYFVNIHFVMYYMDYVLCRFCTAEYKTSMK